jgi:hypothetical protein
MDSARHGSFSLFQMVLERRVNDRQTKVTMIAERENPSCFRRSVVLNDGVRLRFDKVLYAWLSQ